MKEFLKKEVLNDSWTSLNLDAGDTVLVFENSSLVSKLISHETQKPKVLHVVADSECSWCENQNKILLNSVSNYIEQSTKVFIEAESVYKNGKILSKSGSASIA